ncbi:hypothetical protein B0H13DRAFT_2281930 [Mycena leptocephala]|nr:hypothetical protein B0H13DRAFT_2281930 [Mycena leptocephala]
MKWTQRIEQTEISQISERFDIVGEAYVNLQPDLFAPTHLFGSFDFTAAPQCTVSADVVHLSGHPLSLHFKAFLRNEREDRQRQAATKAIIIGRQKSGAHAPTPIFSADRLNSWKTRDGGTVTSKEVRSKIGAAIIPNGCIVDVEDERCPRPSRSSARCCELRRWRPRPSLESLAPALGVGTRVSCKWFCLQHATLCAATLQEEQGGRNWERIGPAIGCMCTRLSRTDTRCHDNWESLNATGQIPLGQAEGPARRRRDRRLGSFMVTPPTELDVPQAWRLMK